MLAVWLLWSYSLILVFTSHVIFICDNAHISNTVYMSLLLTILPSHGLCSAGEYNKKIHTCVSTFTYLRHIHTSLEPKVAWHLPAYSYTRCLEKILDTLYAGWSQANIISNMGWRIFFFKEVQSFSYTFYIYVVLAIRFLSADKYEFSVVYSIVVLWPYQNVYV